MNILELIGLENVKKGIFGDARRLLRIVILFAAGNAFAGGFLNIFLFQATGSIVLIVGQNVLFAATLLVAFLVGTQMLTKYNVTTIMRLGIIFTLLYYLMILLLQPWIGVLLVPLGIVHGIGNGLYWCALNILLARVVDDESRGKFFGIQQIFGNSFGIFVPTVSGFIIVAFTGFTGYYILFAVAVILQLVAVFLSFRIQGFKSEKQLNALPVLAVKGNKYWMATKLYSMSFGFSTHIFMQTFVLFAFAVLDSELQVGNFNSVTAIISVLSAMWITRRISMKNQRQVHLVGAIIHFIILFGLGVFANIPALIVVFIGIGVVQSWGNNISQSVKFQLANKSEEDSHHTKEEFLIATEFPIAFGRVVGLLTTLVIAALLPEITAYRILMLICSVCWLANHLILKQQVNWLEG